MRVVLHLLCLAPLSALKNSQVPAVFGIPQFVPKANPAVDESVAEQYKNHVGKAVGENVAAAVTKGFDMQDQAIAAGLPPYEPGDIPKASQKAPGQASGPATPAYVIGKMMGNVNTDWFRKSPM